MIFNHKLNFYLISVCGASASGKSSLLDLIRTNFGDDVSIVSQDDYYKDIDQQIKDKKGIYNFDLPEAIDHEAFIHDLHQLSEGKIIERPEYTFNHPHKIPELRVFKPAPIVVVEGLFINYTEELNELINLKVFVDADLEICFERRKERDIKIRQIPEDIFTHQWKKHVLPAYKLHVKPCRKMANFIIDNNSNMTEGFAHLKAFMHSILKPEE
ncbi:MAG: deoxynucleoside kinase [Bacteroidetes bacterium]|jgi:uridine kinase|nr:deoxynucleoside kinase [Bacteroidota bacterium]MBT4337385.1 deoxynucleoside kinase [Bacteroidota bacterium]